MTEDKFLKIKFNRLMNFVSVILFLTNMEDIVIP